MLNKALRERGLRRRLRAEYCGAFDSYRTIYIHIPRTAGSFISMSLFGHQVSHATIRDYYRRDYEKARSYFKFAFVRDPLSRLYSAFHYLRGGGMNDADRRFARSHLRDPGFAQFVQRLSQDPGLLQWPHFRPQYLYLYDGTDARNILVNFVGRVESLDKDLERIEQQLNVSIPRRRMNASGVSPPRDRDVSAETRARVEELYAVDYETFGYKLVDGRSG